MQEVITMTPTMVSGDPEDHYDDDDDDDGW